MAERIEEIQEVLGALDRARQAVELWGLPRDEVFKLTLMDTPKLENFDLPQILGNLENDIRKTTETEVEVVETIVAYIERYISLKRAELTGREYDNDWMPQR
jgi:hypothetical protein